MAAWSSLLTTWLAQTTGNLLNHSPGYEGYVFDYKDTAELYFNRDYGNYNGFRAVFPSWDNTARTGLKGTIGLNGTPENYEFWLSEALRKTTEDYPNAERLVFINAWNEWAEGCHLEPDRKYGRGFLESTFAQNPENQN